LRIVQGVVLGIPLVGTGVSMILFGGEFPGHILSFLYVVHVVVVPVGLTLLVFLRLRLARGQKPAQFPGPGRTEDNVVGLPVFPTAVTKAVGLFFITIGVLVLMAATLTVSPVWLYGPSSPGEAGAGSQPDWYTGFLDGALRLVPPGWEFSWLGRTWTLAVLAPLAVIGVFFAVVAAYPFLEARVTGDRSEHHLLDRPRLTPTRTGIGVAGMVFYGTLWASGSADLLATQFRLSFEGVIHTLQAVLLLGPVVAFAVTRRICRDLQDADAELVRHGIESGRLLRLPDGGYTDVHRSLSPAERWRRRAVEARPPQALEEASDQRPKATAPHSAAG
jgi:ubiquinol-cytochrome c reductase cytochrome b subunit